MSTITIPALLAGQVRSGLYEQLQTTYEALDAIITASDRDDPRHAVKQHQLLDAFTAVASALNGAGPASQPSMPFTLGAEHRPVLIDAIRAAASTESYMTEELPELTPRRQQAHATIKALNGLAEQIQTQQEISPPEDLYLQRLIVLAVLDQRHPEGHTHSGLHQTLDEYPAEGVEQATGQLAALGLLLTGERIQPTVGLRRVDELDLICI